MLLCDPTGDPKVSRQGLLVWDCGWTSLTLHLLGFSAKVPSIPAEL